VLCALCFVGAVVKCVNLIDTFCLCLGNFVEGLVVESLMLRRKDRRFVGKS
jgi:hypothetical protein